MRRLIAAVGLALAAGLNAEDLGVLTDEPGKQLETLLMRDFHAAIDRRAAAFESIKGRADCEQWQKDRRDFFLRQIGGLPARTPLNARTVRRLQGEGYRVENVLFQSRPNHHVTGTRALPVTRGP